jgi:hypothetical protein
VLFPTAFLAGLCSGDQVCTVVCELGALCRQRLSGVSQVGLSKPADAKDTGNGVCQGLDEKNAAEGQIGAEATRLASVDAESTNLSDHAVSRWSNCLN